MEDDERTQGDGKHFFHFQRLLVNTTRFVSFQVEAKIKRKVKSENAHNFSFVRVAPTTGRAKVTLGKIFNIEKFHKITRNEREKIAKL